MMCLVNDYKGRYCLDFIEVSVQPLNGEHIHVSPFFSLNEAADRIGDLRHEFTPVRYYPHIGAFINEALCDSRNDMRLALPVGICTIADWLVSKDFAILLTISD